MPSDKGAPRLIVFGNEKGGSGKSTAAIHAAIGLLRRGLRVASLDLDARQATLSRFLEMRAEKARRDGIDLPSPTHLRLELAGSEEQAGTALDAALAELAAGHDAVVIDTPGSAGLASTLAHARADLLVTPLNDSLIDLDLLARIDPESGKILGPSRYAEMVWDQRKARFARDRGSIDWVVMRNRLGHADALNKREIARLLGELSKRIAFRLAPGFGERVIFRELFLDGLTLMDLKQVRPRRGLSMSQLAGRQEVRGLLQAMIEAPR